jgi:hypothetical protein
MKPQMATVQVLDTKKKSKDYVALTTWNHGLWRYHYDCGDAVMLVLMLQ